MNYEHTSISPPENTFLWRYITVQKFEDLITSSELYLHRLDKFIDQYEGVVTEYTNEVIENLFLEFENAIEMQNELYFLLSSLRKITFINCWHINHNENIEMWKTYADLNNGILIKTTEEKLINSLTDPKLGSFHLRPIRYAKRDSREIDLSFPLELINFKDEIYSFENEYRLSLQYYKGEIDPKDADITIVNAPEKGVRIPINLKTLIDEIFVSPNCDQEFFDRIQGLVEKLNIKIRRSTIS
jgi:hypothetical protein